NVHREGNDLVLVNGLGADIRGITLADEHGQLYEGGRIPAGAKATLKKSKAVLQTMSDTWREFSQAGLLGMCDQSLTSRQPNPWRVLYQSGNWVTAIKGAAEHPEDLLL